MSWERCTMKFFSRLFDSDWRAHGDSYARTRQERHYESMPEQVIANRKEIIHLQSELDRVSGDLAQAIVLNRTLTRLLISQKLCKPEDHEKMLTETLEESRQDLSPDDAPSKFCEDCGRPLPRSKQTCPYCKEAAMPQDDSEDKKTKKTKKKSRKKKKKTDGSEPEENPS